MKNPFKFGTVVEGTFFTDRKNELKEISDIIESNNHLILISPRRFGKTSLILKAVKNTKRPHLFLDLQLLTDVNDFASELLKRIFKIYPLEKVKHLIRNFRIIPTLQLNPVTNSFDIAFQPQQRDFIVLEDVFNLVEQLGSKGARPILILDEFQEIRQIDKHLDKQLRSVIQHHKHINYVFLGSMESMMLEIFERKKSPFYHFGVLKKLEKIQYSDFFNFVKQGFKGIAENADIISEKILEFTNNHPYYTQQLAFYVWMSISTNGNKQNVVQTEIQNIIQLHNIDYERLWNTFNNTNKKIMIGLSEYNLSPMSEAFSRKISVSAASTIFSGLSRLMKQGYLIKNDKYEIDDPFFKKWIQFKRNS